MSLEMISKKFESETHEIIIFYLNRLFEVLKRREFKLKISKSIKKTLDLIFLKKLKLQLTGQANQNKYCQIFE